MALVKPSEVAVALVRLDRLVSNSIALSSIGAISCYLVDRSSSYCERFTQSHEKARTQTCITEKLIPRHRAS